MSFAFIYPIINLTSDKSELLEKTLLAGAMIVQLRAKELSNQKFLEFTLKAIKLRDSINLDCKIIINDNIEIAAIADGLHLGQQDLNPIEAREILGYDKIIGLSTHNLEQIKSAPVQVLNYIALGPIYNSITKSGHAPEVGLDLISKAKKLTTLPLVAIGGINSQNASLVYKAGADSIASISDLEKSMEIKELILNYQKAKRSNLSPLGV